MVERRRWGDKTGQGSGGRVQEDLAQIFRCQARSGESSKDPDNNRDNYRNTYQNERERALGDIESRRLREKLRHLRKQQVPLREEISSHSIEEDKI